MKKILFLNAVAVLTLFLFSCSPAKEHYRVTITEFYHPECETCVSMMPVVDAVQAEFKGKVLITRISLETKEGAMLASQFSLINIPLLVFYDAQGIQYYRHEGNMTKEDIENVIKLKM
jgi:thioredoxin-like negative regulator of GroEL